MYIFLRSQKLDHAFAVSSSSARLTRITSVFPFLARPFVRLQHFSGFSDVFLISRVKITFLLYGFRRIICRKLSVLSLALFILYGRSDLSDLKFIFIVFHASSGLLLPSIWVWRSLFRILLFLSHYQTKQLMYCLI